MKTKFTYFMAMIFSFLGCNAQPTAYQSVDVESFAKVMSQSDAVLLDVRRADEYAEGHLPGAIQIDVTQSDFETQALAILPKQHTIALYCRSGNRSKRAAEILSKAGFKVVELSSGYMGWTGAGKPTSREEVDLFQMADGTLVYTYCIKHGTVKIRVADQWIYVDPVINLPPATDYSSMPKADILLITHEHGDHLDAKAVAQLTQPSTQLITNPRSAEQLGMSCCKVMKNGDSQSVCDITIQAVPAYNSSADKQQFHPQGRDNGYVLTIHPTSSTPFRIYIAGDTEDIPEMQQLQNIDVAFMPCNLPYTMTPEQLAHAARIVRPRILFPYHYGQTDIQQVVKLLSPDKQIDVRIRQYQ